MHEFARLAGRFLHVVEQTEVGRFLQAARERAGLTQKELASKIGKSESTISNLERGQHPPTLDQVNDLVLALAEYISPETLLMAMGIRMTPAPAAKLPLKFVMTLLDVHPDDLPVVSAAARGQVALRRLEEAQGRR